MTDAELNEVAKKYGLGKWQSGGVFPLFIARKKSIEALREAVEQERVGCITALDEMRRDAQSSVRRSVIGDCIYELEKRRPS